ncbi:MAG: iron donor protein CyaY [Polyangiaceae bacterium]|nr:iron donor protein CyaY [Polyangiaceae bacterium]MCW5791062.1 iron donor protein CyaY [Polyangiaceae bacterium]
MDEAEYERRAFPELRALVGAIDALEADGLEAELSGDILSLSFESGDEYVINSHRAARQIWMAAERTAWHFDWDEAGGHWVARKTGDELWATVASVLSRKLGRPVSLSQSG